MEDLVFVVSTRNVSQFHISASVKLPVFRYLFFIFWNCVGYVRGESALRIPMDGARCANLQSSPWSHAPRAKNLQGARFRSLTGGIARARLDVAGTRRLYIDSGARPTGLGGFSATGVGGVSSTGVCDLDLRLTGLVWRTA